MSDKEAQFREFVAARMESLRGLAYLTCGDWSVAEDAVLATLARLYVKWNRIDNHDGYARTAVVRAAIDETRRPWWRREQSHSHAMPDPAGPDDATRAVDDRLDLRQALLRLPSRQRAVVVLRFLEGLSVQQTAAALRCPEGTVKAYTSRGLDALRKTLGVDLRIDERTEACHEAAVSSPPRTRPGGNVPRRGWSPGRKTWATTCSSDRSGSRQATGPGGPPARRCAPRASRTATARSTTVVSCSRFAARGPPRRRCSRR
ncbi:SigE family RNA polymerase sigma factor [Micromonosporaceae bacterium Da 78-11]